MHRSGTSIVAKALAETGLCFGNQHIDVQSEINKDGFYEDSRVVAINNLILERNGHQWWSIDTFEDSFFDQSVSDICDFFSEVEVDRYAIKDPRLCLTLSAWIKAAFLSNINVKCIWVDRLSSSIAMSLYYRDLLPPVISKKLVEKYKDSFKKAIGSSDILLAEVSYPPKSNEMVTPNSIDSWLIVRDCRAFTKEYLACFDPSQNRNSSDSDQLSFSDLNKLLERWEKVNTAIGVLEHEIISGRDRWIKERVGVALEKDELWYQHLEQRLSLYENDRTIILRLPILLVPFKKNLARLKRIFFE
jgi:hypothetical protein